MSTDNYTKIVLTAIALCLMWLCVNPLLHPTAASAQNGPEDVRIVGWTAGTQSVQVVNGPTDVRVVNTPSEPENVRIVSGPSGPHDVRIVGWGGDLVQYSRNPDGSVTTFEHGLPVRAVGY
jgi:hypothetical protein